MTDVDCYGETGSHGARGQSTRNWTTSSLSWTAKHGGKALGYSVRALRETGTLITGAHRATTQTIKASGRAADALFASAAGQLPLQIPIGTRIRKKKRIRRLQKQSAHLRQKMGLKIAAGLDAEDTDSTEDVTVTVRNLAQALRVRAVEIAELRSKLELSRTGTEARAASERIKRKTQPVPEKPTAAQESMVMAGGPRKERTRTETARTEDVADEEPAGKALPAGEPRVGPPHH